VERGDVKESGGEWEIRESVSKMPLISVNFSCWERKTGEGNQKECKEKSGTWARWRRKRGARNGKGKERL